MNVNKKIKLLEEIEYEKMIQFLKRPRLAMERMSTFKNNFQNVLFNIMIETERKIYDNIIKDNEKSDLFDNLVLTIKNLETERKEIEEEYIADITTLLNLNNNKDCIKLYLKIAKPKKYKKKYQAKIKKIISDDNKLEEILVDLKDTLYYKSYNEASSRYNMSTKNQLDELYNEYMKMTNSIISHYKKMASYIKEGMK